MKLLLALALVTLAIGAPFEEEERINGENGWYVPQEDGTFEWMFRTDAESKLDSVIEDRASTVVEFYLYTKSNPETAQQLSASDAVIKTSNFNKANPTRFVIHGYNDNHEGAYSALVRDAWLSRGDFNVIVVDWSSRAQTYNVLSSIYYVPAVGKLVAEFIDYLNASQGMSFSTLTVIGHSLGAHVAGFTGKNTQNGQVDTIIGLDPALALYSYDNPSTRLASTDAYYVESIQTDGGNTGFLKPIGKSTFYPNGGTNQPGCDGDNGCSHERSWLYYIEAVRQNDFPSMKCANYEDAVNKDCGATYSSVRLGAVTNANMAAGDFYTPVNSESPFGKGA